MADGRMRIGVVLPIAQAEADGIASLDPMDREDGGGVRRGCRARFRAWVGGAPRCRGRSR